MGYSAIVRGSLKCASTPPRTWRDACTPSYCSATSVPRATGWHAVKILLYKPFEYIIFDKERGEVRLEVLILSIISAMVHPFDASISGTVASKKKQNQNLPVTTQSIKFKLKFAERLLGNQRLVSHTCLYRMLHWFRELVHASDKLDHYKFWISYPKIRFPWSRSRMVYTLPVAWFRG